MSNLSLRATHQTERDIDPVFCNQAHRVVTRIPLTPDTVHGYLSNLLRPVISISSGECVEVSTLVCNWAIRPFRTWKEAKRHSDWVHFQELGHALTGPIYVKDAKPGDVLRIKFMSIETGDWGFSFGGPFNDKRHLLYGLKDDEQRLLQWKLNSAERKAECIDLPITLASRPFFGVVALAPADSGEHPTGPPRRTGGNIDCPMLQEGSSIYLPVEVEGALLSVGDGHALQGLGEISGSAIECPIKRATFSVDVLERGELYSPAIEFGDQRILLGLGQTADQAIHCAVTRSVNFLSAAAQLDKPTAFNLASLITDIGLTEIVNGTVCAYAKFSTSDLNELAQKDMFFSDLLNKDFAF